MADENTIEGTEVSPDVVQTPEAEAPAREGRGPRGGRGGRGGGGGRGGDRGGRGRRDDRRGGRGGEEGGEELVEKLVHINRVSKTVKGGKRFGFAALGASGHRHHRGRPDARGVREPRSRRRGDQVGRHVQPLQHDPRDLRGAR